MQALSSPPAVPLDTPGVVDVVRVGAVGFAPLRLLLAALGLQLREVPAAECIPGSYWGECEAGLIGVDVFAREDTPIHSLLHEASHLLVMPPARRASLHTDASDCQQEEDASCYLQILLADRVPGVGRARLMADMDAWGYSFRLGSAQAWFEGDASDAREFLALHHPALLASLIDDRPLAPLHGAV